MNALANIKDLIDDTQHVVQKEYKLQELDVKTLFSHQAYTILEHPVLGIGSMEDTHEDPYWLELHVLENLHSFAYNNPKATGTILHKASETNKPLGVLYTHSLGIGDNWFAVLRNDDTSQILSIPDLVSTYEDVSSWVIMTNNKAQFPLEKSKVPLTYPNRANNDQIRGIHGRGIPNINYESITSILPEEKDVSSDESVNAITTLALNIFNRQCQLYDQGKITPYPGKFGEWEFRVGELVVKALQTLKPKILKNIPERSFGDRSLENHLGRDLTKTIREQYSFYQQPPFSNRK